MDGRIFSSAENVHRLLYWGTDWCRSIYRFNLCILTLPFPTAPIALAQRSRHHLIKGLCLFDSSVPFTIQYRITGPIKPACLHRARRIILAVSSFVAVSSSIAVSTSGASSFPSSQASRACLFDSSVLFTIQYRITGPIKPPCLHRPRRIILAVSSFVAATEDDTKRETATTKNCVVCLWHSDYTQHTFTPESGPSAQNIPFVYSSS